MTERGLVSEEWETRLRQRRVWEDLAEGTRRTRLGLAPHSALAALPAPSLPISTSDSSL